MISFLLGTRRVDLEDLDPNTTVLDWLRATGRVGTKEGCASGDCGACTVTVVAPADDDPDELDYRPVNSCIALVGSLDATQLVTVEDLADPDTGQLHPVQEALVDRHGSQCGFCTPGFVMSLFAWMHRAPTTERHDVDTTLSGNLCRCTGYRPIIAAARDLAESRPEDRFDRAGSRTRVALDELAEERAMHGSATLDGAGNTWVAPRTLEAACAELARTPHATVVAGGTDLVLAITQQDQVVEHLVDVTAIPELQDVATTDDRLVVGAAAPLVTVAPALVRHWPAVAELFDRYGSVPVRTRATLGGNLATASPIGDSPPLLLALGADVVVASATGRRVVPLDDFFRDYRRTVLADDEVIVAISIPLPVAGQVLSVSKVSKRRDDDISAVCGVFNLTLDGGRVTAARVAFGGMAATPARARGCEAALVDTDLGEAGLAAARAALADDFAPIDDMRASADYRARVAANLVTRMVRETRSTQRLRVDTIS